MKSLDHNKLSCKFSHHGYEMLGEKWMGSCPTWECGWFEEEPDDPIKAELIDKYIDTSNKQCDKSCAGYTPVETFICKKHDTEYTGICEDCETENDLLMMQAEKEYNENKP
jgi:hypothetical protein